VVPTSRKVSWLRSSRLSDNVSYLQLLEREAAASANPAVVLKSRASHNGAELVEGTRGDGGSLGLTGGTSRLLLAGLYFQVLVNGAILQKAVQPKIVLNFVAYLVEVGANPTLPVLAEVCSTG
jgi:hypothetical protein